MNRVIPYNQLPARSPLIFTMLIYLILDRFQAIGLIWGICITLLALIWIAFIVAFFKQKLSPVLFKEDNKP